MRPLPAILHDAYVFADASHPGDHLFIPMAPGPEIGADGEATLSLFAGPQGGFLQLATRWALAQSRLEALRAELGLASHQLRPLPIEVEAVCLDLAVDSAAGDGGEGHEGGEFNTLAEVPSAGYPPYSAIFSATLSAADQGRAMQALHGLAGRLRVVYRGTYGGPVPVTLRLDEGWLRGLPSPIDEGSLRRALEAALDAGEMPFAGDLPPGIDRATWRGLGGRVVEAAVRWWSARRATAGVSPFFSCTLRHRDSELLPFECSTDIASWFEAGRGAQRIQLLPSGGTTARRSDHVDVGQARDH